MRARAYRTRLSLRLAVLAACALWATVLVAVARHPGAGGGARAGALLFVLFFASYAALQARAAILVTPDGFVFRTAFRRVAVRVEDILGVRVVNGLGATSYAVVTRRGLFRFTSLFARHRELLELMLRRARLVRSA